MSEDEKIAIWLNYMVTQKSLIYFPTYCKVLPQNEQYWRKLKFPILRVNYGTENHPKINIIPLEEFTEDHFNYWKEIMENKSGLIKWNSNCNRIPKDLIYCDE